MGDRRYGQRTRVGGDVESGSIQRVGNQVQFVLLQDKTKLKVAYTGTDPLPDTFKDGAQALADGKLDKDGVFPRRTHPGKVRFQIRSQTGAAHAGQERSQYQHGKASI